MLQVKFFIFHYDTFQISKHFYLLILIPFHSCGGNFFYLFRNYNFTTSRGHIFEMIQWHFTTLSIKDSIHTIEIQFFNEEKVIKSTRLYF